MIKEAPIWVSTKGGVFVWCCGRAASTRDLESATIVACDRECWCIKRNPLKRTLGQTYPLVFEVDRPSSIQFYQFPFVAFTQLCLRDVPIPSYQPPLRSHAYAYLFFIFIKRTRYRQQCRISKWRIRNDSRHQRCRRRVEQNPSIVIRGEILTRTYLSSSSQNGIQMIP